MIIPRTMITVCLLFFFFIPCSGYAAEQVDAYKQEAVEWIEANHHMFDQAELEIHEFAEIALKEYRSSKYLADMLEKGGFTVRRGVADKPKAKQTVWFRTPGDWYSGGI